MNGGKYELMITKCKATQRTIPQSEQGNEATKIKAIWF